VGDLGKGGGKVDQVQNTNQHHNRYLPFLHGVGVDHHHHDGGDGHGTGHRHTVGSSQIFGLLEKEHHEDHGGHQSPVDRADIDL
jgi:hypothetical protein